MLKRSRNCHNYNEAQIIPLLPFTLSLSFVCLLPPCSPSSQYSTSIRTCLTPEYFSLFINWNRTLLLFIILLKNSICGNFNSTSKFLLFQTSRSTIKMEKIFIHYMAQSVDCFYFYGTDDQKSWRTNNRQITGSKPSVHYTKHFDAVYAKSLRATDFSLSFLLSKGQARSHSLFSGKWVNRCFIQNLKVVKTRVYFFIIN